MIRNNFNKKKPISFGEMGYKKQKLSNAAIMVHIIRL